MCPSAPVGIGGLCNWSFNGQPVDTFFIDMWKSRRLGVRAMYDSRDSERKPSLLKKRKLGLDLGFGELVDLESS